VIVLPDFKALEARAADVKGKIVLFNACSDRRTVPSSDRTVESSGRRDRDAGAVSWTDRPTHANTGAIITPPAH
jgi:hypothetical protein